MICRVSITTSRIDIMAAGSYETNLFEYKGVLGDNTEAQTNVPN